MTYRKLISFFRNFKNFKNFKLQLKKILKFDLFDNNKIIVEDIDFSDNIILIVLYQMVKDKYMIIKIPYKKFYNKKNININGIEFINCPVFFKDKYISYEDFKEEIGIN